MIFISVDLPAPLTPSTPIFHAGEKDSVNAFEDLSPAGEGLGRSFITVELLVKLAIMLRLPDRPLIGHGGPGPRHPPGPVSHGGPGPQ